MGYKAIIWDLDGTLLDTLQDLTNAVNHILEVYGCPQRTKVQIRSFLGNGAANLIAQSLPGKPEDPALERVLRDYLSYYAAHDRDADADRRVRPRRCVFAWLCSQRLRDGRRAYPAG